MTDHITQNTRVPDFSSREEEAEWWDTHSFVDHLDELEPVQIQYTRTRYSQLKPGDPTPG
ncbi:hypothetical protein BH09CHL1_BH09CHL1_02460 [soil metagenome]